MILKVFAIHDSKAEAYLQPFFAPTIGLALRSFEIAANDPNTQFFKHPSDFTLFQIGNYDDETADLIRLEPKVALSNALEQKKSHQQQPIFTKENEL